LLKRVALFAFFVNLPFVEIVIKPGWQQQAKSAARRPLVLLCCCERTQRFGFVKPATRFKDKQLSRLKGLLWIFQLVAHSSSVLHIAVDVSKAINHKAGENFLK